MKSQNFKSYLLIIGGTALMCISLYFFTSPNGFVLGGVSGLGIILGRLTSMSLGTWLTLLNVLLLIVGWISLGSEVGIKTVFCTLLFSLGIDLLEILVPLDHPLTGQPFLELCCAVLITGVGQAMIFHADASSGGTDILALILRKHTHMNVGRALLFVDIIICTASFFAINVEEPIFESQTKIKLGSTTMSPDGVSINKYIGDFVKQEVDNYLHIHQDVAEVIENKIKESERERKEMAGVTKKARERAKKANLHNRKLRDCRIHFSDVKNDRKEESCIFITEGDSASGSITKSRDVNTQAVFSLRGKPLNSFGLTKKVVYENEEFNLLQAALDIEEGLDTLRYNKVIVATDADVDGMHIRLLIITFFLQFFPELIKKGHVYVLQTPLFRVRNRRTKIKNKKVLAEADAKSEGKKADFITRYCYSEEERVTAIQELGPDPEITRFKGLGEISPEEFAGFIGPDIRLEQVTLHKNDQVQKLLEYYMGKNTMERQNFIIDNLVIEEDRPEEEEYE